MQKRNLSREKIIRVALSLADEVGLNQLTFPRIAEKLEIKYPSLYNHFANMDDLRKEMTVYLYQELNARLMNRLLGKSGEDAIREYARVYREFAFENRSSYGLLTSIPRVKNEEASGLAKENNEIILRILDFHTKDRTQLVHKSRMLRSLLHGFISMSFLGYFHGDVDIEDSFQSMIDDFITTLR